MIFSRLLERIPFHSETCNMKLSLQLLFSTDKEYYWPVITFLQVPTSCVNLYELNNILLGQICPDDVGTEMNVTRYLRLEATENFVLNITQDNFTSGSGGKHFLLNIHTPCVFCKRFDNYYPFVVSNVNSTVGQ